MVGGKSTATWNRFVRSIGFDGMHRMAIATDVEVQAPIVEVAGVARRDGISSGSKKKAKDRQRNSCQGEIIPGAHSETLSPRRQTLSRSSPR